MGPEETPEESETQKATIDKGIPPTSSYQFEVWEEAGLPWASHLNWQWGSGIDKRAPGKTSTSAGVSQEGDRGEVRWEHAGTNWREYSRRAPGDLFGLQEEEFHSTKQANLLTLSEKKIIFNWYD